MNPLYRAAALGLLLLATGCYHIRYVTQLPPEPLAAERVWHDTFVFGLVEASAPIDVARTCPRGVAVIDSYESVSNFVIPFFGEALISSVFLVAGAPVFVNIWSPVTVETTCASR